MLQLKNIVKQYGDGENIVTALDGINITFRENEFVAILGHSGCGKTTTLNIIGGLDHYTSGDLIINGKSTKEYKDKDWDAYRNHSVGFIFQSYNLIPHQTVLSNVELALTISGVSKSERRKRAIEALEKVGLGNQIHKRPNQMSGGQMQRVAIARALINNPDILLADEPTGALDSETSIQVMELLKEIAKDKLVIMVTHNPELAEEYATRIVRVKDGSIVDDTNPFTPEKEDEILPPKKERVSMSFGTAVSLSLNNLMTKKGRTILTSFAGSIGIIGIALILSLSTGINSYINEIQEDTLSSYPITILQETTDTASMMTTMMNKKAEAEETPREGVYANTDTYEMFNAMNSSAKQINNMREFKKFLDSDEIIQDNVAAISYSYNVGLQIFTKNPAGDIIKCDLGEIYENMSGKDGTSASIAMNSMLSMMNLEMWEEFTAGNNGELINDMVYDQYDLVYGNWPKAKDEVVVILSKTNEIPDIVLYTLGMKDSSKLPSILKSAMKGELIEDYGQTQWTYEEFIQKQFKVIPQSECYTKKDSSDEYINFADTEAGREYLYNSDDVGIPLKIVGFIKPSEDSNMSQSTTYLGYTTELTKYIIEQTNNSEIVKAQLADETFDVINNLPIMPDDYEEPSFAQKVNKARDYLNGLSEEEKLEVYKFMSTIPSEDEIQTTINQQLSMYTPNQIETMMTTSYAEQMGVDTETIKSYISQMDKETLDEYIRQAIKEQFVQQYAAAVIEQLSNVPTDMLLAQLSSVMYTDDQFKAVYDEYIPDTFSKLTNDQVLARLGYADFDNPSKIKIYAKTFAQKDNIAEAIEAYNDRVSEEDEIKYTDYVALLMSSITNIISGISYLLIAFVAISLIVSSIMIGIITYISVLERTREIGILRAIGASKKDITTVFNAETLLVGFCSGFLGILTSVIMLIPINAIIHSLTKLDNLKAVLPVGAAIILVLISMTLTLIAGLIPSKMAAKKDPVEALRTE